MCVFQVSFHPNSLYLETLLNEGINFGGDSGERTEVGRRLPPLKDGAIGSTCNATVAVVSSCCSDNTLCSALLIVSLHSVVPRSIHLTH